MALVLAAGQGAANGLQLRPGDSMTIADLAAALRGMPRSARLLIDTPDGLRELRMIAPTHLAVAADGTVSGSVAGDGAEYGVVLFPAGREP